MVGQPADLTGLSPRWRTDLLRCFRLACLNADSEYHPSSWRVSGENRKLGKLVRRTLHKSTTLLRTISSNVFGSARGHSRGYPLFDLTGLVVKADVESKNFAPPVVPF